VPRAFTDNERAHIQRALLAAGRKALATGGLRRTAVAALCREAGISKGAFYLFFESKEALFITLMQEAETELRAGLDALAASKGAPRDILAAVLRLIFASVRTHPLLRALVDPEEFAWVARAIGPAALEAAQADDRRYFAGLLARLQARGIVQPSLDPDVFAGLAGAALALAQGEHLVGERAEAVTALLVDGLVDRLLV
jgi:AcrR family transcriptional regulator